MLQRTALGFSFCLTPLLLVACGAVTPDDGGLFASVANAPDGGGGTGGSGTGGSGPNNGSGGGGPASQVIAAADSCDNAFAISLNYGQVFRGKGNTTGDTSPVEEAVCENDANVVVDGPDRVHAVTVNAPEGGYLTARLLRGAGKTEFDSVLYLRQFCAGGAGTVCEDAFIVSRGGAREGVPGGDLISVPVAPSAQPTTLFLFVDGVGAGAGGPYELEVSLNRGNCEDPIPIFVEPGSPVRGRVTTDVAENLMTHSCSAAGTVDVMFKVTRSSAGPMGVQVNSVDSDLAIAFMDQTCNGKGGTQVERTAKCIRAPEAFLGEAAWPDAQRSVYVAIDAGIPSGNGREFTVTFDPAGGLDL